MKKKILILMTLATLVFATSAQADLTIPAIVTTDLNVREQPDKNAKIIDVLPEGAEVLARDSGKFDWNKIDFGDYVGYVYNAYLTDKNSSTTLYNIYSNFNPVVIPQQNTSTATQETTTPDSQQTSSRTYTIEEFKHAGIVEYGGWRWTYYLMSMFPGSTSTPCPGRWINDEGFVCDPDGYVILASVDLAPYTVVETPFGYMGKVYDTGCPHGILDVYTNW